LLVKVANDSIYPISTNILTYDFKQDAPGKSPEILNITYDQRIRVNLNCDKSGFQLYGA
jgi:hypothetical protein